MDSDETLRKYYLAGLNQSEMLLYLERECNLKWSLSKLKRKLKSLGLFRRKNFSAVEEVAEFIEQELQTSNKENGYKWMHKQILKNGLITTRETVRVLMKAIDPEGVRERTRKRLKRRIYTSKGPGYIWHIDGNDKLKPFGISIHAGIDGYSRFVLWLKASSTNKNPKKVAAYFVEAMEENKGFPLTIRADRGTENGVIEVLQKSLREKYTDSERPSFLYGKSTANQKIEAWWTILRTHFTQFYLDLFKQLENDGYYEGSSVDKALIQFCFLSSIQKELDNVRTHWNTHIIRKSKNGQLPSGKPCNLYFFPDRYGGEDQIIEITDEQDYQDARDCCDYGLYICDENIYNASYRIMREKDLELPKDAYSALNLYVTLREEVERLMQ